MLATCSFNNSLKFVVFSRKLSTSFNLNSRFDPKLFVEPIVDLKEVNFINIFWKLLKKFF